MAVLDAMQEQNDQSDWIEQSRGEMDKRYLAARRHSRFVRALKIALPTVSVIGVVAFLVFVYVLPEIPPSFAAGSIDVTHNSIVMENPHVSGFMKGGRSYELRADRAEQSLLNTKVVTLQNIGATIGLGNDQTAKVAAASGTYYTDTQRIVLTDKINFSTTSGIQGSLESADIDLKQGTMSSDRPLAFHSEGSTIRAKGVQVQDRGERISFRNGVKVTYAVPSESTPASNRPTLPVTE